MNINIRQEVPKDYEVTYNLVRDSFKEAEHTDGNEQDLVVKLRKGNSFIPELSLVAEIDNKIVGHILFTKGSIEGNPILVLAPVSVLPDYQGKGIGGQLIQRGHEIARALGYKGIILLGHPTYYPKFGYKISTLFDIRAPFEVPEDCFMAIELEENSLKNISGTVKFPLEFGI